MNRDLYVHMSLPYTVLHGESLDYGSKTSSLKAIALVNYVDHVLEVEKENPWSLGLMGMWSGVANNREEHRLVERA